MSLVIIFRIMRFGIIHPHLLINGMRQYEQSARVVLAKDAVDGVRWSHMHLLYLVVE